MSASRDELASRAWRAMSDLVLSNDRKAQVSDELGLSFARVRVLRRLIDRPLTLRGLAERLAADPPYVTLMIDDLEDRGLVKRVPHPTDRRAKLVKLTAKGRGIATRAEAMLESPPAEFDALGTEDVAELARILARLRGPDDRIAG